MPKINLEESFSAPLGLLGKASVILVPILGTSLVALLLSLITPRGFRGWEILILALVSLIVILFGTAWTTLLLLKHFQGKNPDLRTTWIELSENLENLLVAVIMVTVIISVDFFLFLVPGIILSTLFLITISQVAVEKTTFDRSVVFMSHFVFAEKNFLVLLLYATITFLLALIHMIGSFCQAFFVTLYLPYLYLKYGRESA